MLNLNSLFKDFDEKINLTNSKKDNLRRSRNAIRSKIKESFKENGRKVPKFCGQGSFMMKTIINPSPEDEDAEYDIDDGVYLEEKPSVSTAHRWIKKALEDHTEASVKDKNTCVRIIYAGDYHVDLPCYVIENKTALLAHKSNGWVESDPKAFTDWFRNEINIYGEQLRRTVRYLKAWKDYKNVDLDGIILTILAAKNIAMNDNRDDKSLLSTVTNIYNKLNQIFVCYKPVTPYEDLLEDDSKKERVLDSLKIFKERLDTALNDKDNNLEATILLRKEFGNRFPKGEETDAHVEEYKKTERSAILRDEGRSG